MSPRWSGRALSVTPGVMSRSSSGPGDLNALHAESMITHEVRQREDESPFTPLEQSMGLVSRKSGYRMGSLVHGALEACKEEANRCRRSVRYVVFCLLFKPYVSGS